MNLTLNPFVAGTDSDLRFHQYVAGLLSSTTVDNVMELVGNGAFLFNHNQPSSLLGSKMFVRCVYGPLSNHIDQGLADDVPVAITGSPGIGKTMMRNWYARHLLLKPFGPEEHFRTILLQDGDSSVYYMIKMERELISTTTSSAAQLLPVQVVVTAKKGKNVAHVRELVAPVGNVYTLVDVSEFGSCNCVEEPRMHEDKLVLFVSASASNTVGRRLGKRGTVTYYMPLWSVVELLQANITLGLNFSDAMISERFDRVGGVARLVFVKTQEWFDRYLTITLLDKAAALELNNTADLRIATTFMERKTFFHGLAYIFVTKNNCAGSVDYTYNDGEMCWGTKYILIEIIAARWQHHLTIQFRALTYTHISSAAPYRHISAMHGHSVGYLFVGWAIRTMQVAGLEGMEWSCAKRAKKPYFMTAFGRGDAFKGRFNLVYVNPVEMAARVRTAPPRTLIVPTSFQYPVIDCVLKASSGTGDVALYASVQITVAHSSVIIESDEAIFMTLMSAVFSDIDLARRSAHIRDRSAIFYIVPPSQYESFRSPKVGTYPGHVLKLTLAKEI